MQRPERADTKERWKINGLKGSLATASARKKGDLVELRQRCVSQQWAPSGNTGGWDIRRQPRGLPGRLAAVYGMTSPFIMAAAGLGEEGRQGSDLGTADGKDARPSGGELQGNGPADSLPAPVTTARHPDNMP